ncbi:MULTISPECIES: hypothetical protein [unclassified Yoonia]|uniref:hypothetical protein n=1 Tax=unclassified Yoonia TaxID=2629118 RepID=UPI002AFF7EEB|nr:MULTISPECIES: hypothetical protein [unclassified Yoonia]
MFSRITSLAPMIARGFVAALLALALTAVSFGHNPPQDDARAQAYLLSGGDWAAICADTGRPLHGVDICMACLIAAGADLPCPASDAATLISVTLADWSMSAHAFTRAQAIPPHPARAPPARDRSYHV